MKSLIKLVLFFFIALSVSSCQTHKMTHYGRGEMEKLQANLKDYKVYIIDSLSTYKVDKPSYSPAGISGSLTPIMDSATVADIKNPKTKKLLKVHKDDLSIYTKAVVKPNASGVILKKDKIMSVVHLDHNKPKFDAALYGEIIGIAALGTLVWIGIINSFGGLL